MSVSCPICQKRKAIRYCPAKGEKICAVCCGTGREATIDCLPDCSHLVAAHRYEKEHQNELPASALFPEVTLSPDFVHANRLMVSGIAYSIVQFCVSQPAASDPDILAALEALAETYKTLSSGIYYEKEPAAPNARGLYGALSKFLAEAKQPQPGQPSLVTRKDSEIFLLLVTVYRMGLSHSNGRLRSRRFIEFLRHQFPEISEFQREESRIILP